MENHISKAESDKERFTEVKHEDIDKVLRILKERLPKSGNVFNCALRLSRHPREFGLYALDGDFTSDAWFVVVQEFTEFDQTISISAPPSVTVTEHVRQAFIDTQIIKWVKPFKFSALDRAVSPMIAEISAFVKGIPTLVNPDFEYYCVPVEAGLNMEIRFLPEEINSEIIIKSLDTEDGARFLTSHWKYAKQGSIEYTSEAIRRNPSAGIYIDGKPASGVMTHADTMIGMLTTDAKHRNKGYALICMRTLIRDLAREGYIPSSGVEQDNEVSKKFHAKCGMSLSHKCDFIFHL